MAGPDWIRGLLAPCLALAVAGAAAAERLVLEDGSVVIGELRGLEAGVYTVESEGLGLVRIPRARVERIESGAAPPGEPPSAAPPAAGPSPSADVTALQQQMLGDGRILGQLLALSESAEVQAILADPEIMALVERGDLEALARNPRFRALLDDPRVGEIGSALGN